MNNDMVTLSKSDLKSILDSYGLIPDEVYIEILESSQPAIPEDLVLAIENVLKADMTAATTGVSYNRHVPETVLELRKVFRKFNPAVNTIIDKALLEVDKKEG